MNHLSTTLEGVTDPVKAGLIGIDYGYQFGVDLQLSVLWVKANYQSTNLWVTDWEADSTGATDRRYTNNTIFVPVMFKVKESQAMSAAVGAYYAFPMSTSDHRDWGLSLGVRGHAAPKLFWEGLVTGGFVEQGFGGQTINFQLGVGYALN